MCVAQRSVNVLRRYADVEGQDQIAAGVFKTTADEIERMIDHIATLERELAEAKAREERLRAQIVSGTTVRIPTAAMEQEFQAHYRRGYAEALATLQQKGDTNADA